MKGETQKALLMSEFSQLYFNENGDPGETFKADEVLARKIKNRFGMEVNESMLLTHLINKIPESRGYALVPFGRHPSPSSSSPSSLAASVPV
jgi:hypothetical protein